MKRKSFGSLIQQIGFVLAEYWKSLEFHRSRVFISSVFRQNRVFFRRWVRSGALRVASGPRCVRPNERDHISELLKSKGKIIDRRKMHFFPKVFWCLPSHFPQVDLEV